MRGGGTLKYVMMLIFLVGCATAAMKKQMVSGVIGCSPENIQISNANGVVCSPTCIYQATCNGKNYQCSQNQGAFGPSTPVCTELKSTSSEP